MMNFLFNRFNNIRIQNIEYYPRIWIHIQTVDSILNYKLLTFASWYVTAFK